MNPILDECSVVWRCGQCNQTVLVHTENGAPKRFECTNTLCLECHVKYDYPAFPVQRDGEAAELEEARGRFRRNLRKAQRNLNQLPPPPTDSEHIDELNSIIAGLEAAIKHQQTVQNAVDIYQRERVEDLERRLAMAWKCPECGIPMTVYSRSGQKSDPAKNFRAHCDNILCASNAEFSIRDIPASLTYPSRTEALYICPSANGCSRKKECLSAAPHIRSKACTSTGTRGVCPGCVPYSPSQKDS